MTLQRRDAAPHQRLVLTASANVVEALQIEAVGAPVECLLASREALQSLTGVDSSGATTGVYVLVGGPEVPLGPGDPIDAYDELLGRSPSAEPPRDGDAEESVDSQEHTTQWRARFYTGLTRDLLRRAGEHSAKPWWSRALLCRQSPPWPYDITAIGYLEGKLHETLDDAYWLKRVGRASKETAVRPDTEHDLDKGHLPAILAAVQLLGVSLDTRDQVYRMLETTGRRTVNG